MKPCRFGRGSLIAAHPFLAAALACHAVALSALALADTSRVEAARHAEIQRETAPSEERARLARSRNLVKEMEAIDREMGGKAADSAPPPAKGEDLTKRALDLVEAIERKDLEARAEKLAELLKISPAEAEAKLKKEAELEKAAHPGGENSPADLQRRAETALAHERQRQGGVAAPGTIGEGYGTGTAGMRLDDSSSHHYEYDSGYDGDRRSYGALHATDILQPGSYRLGAGRSFGPGGVAADRVFVDSWYMIGPFQGRGADSQDTVYPPEDEIDLDAAYTGQNGQLLRWHYVQFPIYPIVPTPPAENAVFYGFTEIDMDEDRDLDLSLGVDDDAIVWLNGRVVWKSGGNDKPWYHAHFMDHEKRVAQMNLSEATVRAHFRKGHNILLFKLYNGVWNMFFSLVIVK